MPASFRSLRILLAIRELMSSCIGLALTRETQRPDRRPSLDTLKLTS